MKKLFTLIFIFLFTLTASGQVYTDIKQYSDMGLDINQLHPQDLLNLGLGNCDLDIIKSAIAKGADINYIEEVNGQFPLCMAIIFAGNARFPDEETVLTSQIRDYGAAVFSGRSVSDLRRDYIEIITFLLQKGAKVNVPSDLYPYEKIPFLIAAENRDIEIINMLLDYDADPNTGDDGGVTALHLLGIAVPVSLPFKDSPEIAKLLISKGARMTEIDMTGATPLTSTREELQIIEDSSSHWQDYPFYNELVNSLKSLIDIYSKL